MTESIVEAKQRLDTKLEAEAAVFLALGLMVATFLARTTHAKYLNHP